MCVGFFGGVTRIPGIRGRDTVDGRNPAPQGMLKPCK